MYAWPINRKLALGKQRNALGEFLYRLTLCVMILTDNYVGNSEPTALSHAVIDTEVSVIGDKTVLSCRFASNNYGKSVQSFVVSD